MIKINLTKSKISEVSGQSQVNFDFDAGGTSGRSQGLIKILLICGFVVGAVLYRGSEIDRLQSEMAVVQNQLNQKQQLLDQKKQEASVQPELEAKAKELEDKLQILRNLSKLRLVEVKALDFIQSIVPEKVWLDSIVYKDAQFNVTGQALTDEDASDFMKALEASPYFDQVILLQSKEQDNRQAGTTKTFEISFVAGNVN